MYNTLYSIIAHLYVLYILSAQRFCITGVLCFITTQDDDTAYGGYYKLGKSCYQELKKLHCCI